LPIRLYRYIFWTGYITVILSSFIPVAGELNKKFLGPESFHVRLDHLLHFLVYFLICMYYLFGAQKGITLFENNSLLKFILSVFFLATTTEVVQLWVPERAFNPVDWMANVSGLFIGLIVIAMQMKRRLRTTGRLRD